MGRKTLSEKNLHYSINNTAHHADIAKTGRALSVPERLSILKLLAGEPRYLVEIAEQLHIPLSSVSRHINILTEAGLVMISYKPGPKGHSKLCAKAAMSTSVSFEDTAVPPAKDRYITEMPIGLYSDCDITAPCGMIGKSAPISNYDNPSVFFSAERVNAELLWFNTGSITYKLPLPSNGDNSPYEELSVSFEICSEAVYHRNNWPSDITVALNDVEIDTFTSPGDFGGRRGKLTPDYWPVSSTQFGLLMRFAVNDKGVFINNALKSDLVTIKDLELQKANFVKLTLAVKDDAVHRGGMNIFGKNFGDYPQSIIMTLI